MQRTSALLELELAAMAGAVVLEAQEVQGVWVVPEDRPPLSLPLLLLVALRMRQAELRSQLAAMLRAVTPRAERAGARTPPAQS